MSNVMTVKSSLLVFKKGDNLAIVTFEKVTIAKSSHLFPQTLPQSQTQTQAKKTHIFLQPSQQGLICDTITTRGNSLLF